jgi:hypothetical protein
VLPLYTAQAANHRETVVLLDTQTGKTKACDADDLAEAQCKLELQGVKRTFTFSEAQPRSDADQGQSTDPGSSGAPALDQPEKK